TADNSAVNPGDYTTNSGTITFAAGSVDGTTQTITVDIIEDSIAEPAETFFVNLSNLVFSGAASISDNQGLGTINDNDAISISLAGFTITETDATQQGNFVASINGGATAQEDIVLSFTTTDGSAGASDYTAQSAVSYTITKGTSSVSIPVDVLGDAISEPTEDFTGEISITNANGQDVSLNTATATSTINDNDSASIAINDVSVNEADGTAVFTVTLTGNIQDQLNADFATADNSAVNPGDYTTNSGTITFVAGSVDGTAQTITVDIIEDAIAEPTETFFVDLSNLVTTGTASISDNQGVGTINDNDAISISLAGFTITETEATQQGNFVASIDGGATAQEDIVLSFTTTDGSAGASDYTAQSAVSYTITKGTSSVNIPVDVLGDDIIESTENFTGAISIVTSNDQDVSITGSNGEATATINDDDIAGLVLTKIAALADTDSSGGDSAGDIITYTFTVENTGNVSLSQIEITDANVTFTAGNIINTLAPGETSSLNATYTLAQADIDAGSYSNQASATGDSPAKTDDITDSLSDDPNTPALDDATVVIFTPQPAIELVKTAVYSDINSNSVKDAGDEITYTFTVTNTGNVTVSNISIDDALTGSNDLAINPADLAPGATGDVSVTYTITQADMDAGFVSNSATATGDSPSGTDDVTDVSDNGDPTDGDNNPTTTPLTQNPAMTIAKAGSFNDENGNGYAEAGETISYTFSLTNT
ncbi:beta strand repeat-containing protein, partial [Christiangramia aestuarii]|uniref:beta strand repeat-containing protein n=1 Tax=Christiangramia aestuarii TaxID=1028746 RepID=UPI0031E66346